MPKLTILNKLEPGDEFRFEYAGSELTIRLGPGYSEPHAAAFEIEVENGMGGFTQYAADGEAMPHPDVPSDLEVIDGPVQFIAW